MTFTLQRRQRIPAAQSTLLPAPRSPQPPMSGPAWLRSRTPAPLTSRLRRRQLHNPHSHRLPPRTSPRSPRKCRDRSRRNRRFETSGRGTRSSFPARLCSRKSRPRREWQPNPLPKAQDPVEAKPSEQPSALPALLSAMPVVDLTVVGRGLDQFMHRLERAGEKLVGDGEGLRPWLVAAAAAATACEIARRQMRRTYDRERATSLTFGTTTDV